MNQVYILLLNSMLRNFDEYFRGVGWKQQGKSKIPVLDYGLIRDDNRIDHGF